MHMHFKSLRELFIVKLVCKWIPSFVFFCALFSGVFGMEASSASSEVLSYSAKMSKLKSNAEESIELLNHDWVENGGLELVIIDSGSDEVESNWGHLYLRFVGSGVTPFEDTTVQAVALTLPPDFGLKRFFKGIFGGFWIVLEFEKLNQIVVKSCSSEFRGFSRTIIPSTRELRIHLLETLKGINNVRTGKDRYYFLTNNCTSYTSWLLNSAGFAQLPAPVPFFPKHASLHFRRSFISPWPDVNGVSKKELHPYLDLWQVRSWKEFSTLNLQRLLAFRGSDLGANRVNVVKELSLRKDIQPMDRVYGINILPMDFYQRNEIFSNQDFELEITDLFNGEQLANAKLYNRSATRDLNTTTFCSKFKDQCEYFNMAQRLMESVRD